MNRPITSAVPCSNFGDDSFPSSPRSTLLPFTMESISKL